MNDTARINDGLDGNLPFLRRANDALCQTAILVGLACLIGLFVAGTFGILHNGNDFDFSFGDVGVGVGGGGGGGDVIARPDVL